MSLITKMRKQNAIYWPPVVADSFGRPGAAALVELTLGAANYRVRWEDVVKQFIDGNGAVTMSQALVYVPRLPDGTEVQVSGYLWLGNRADLRDELNPRANGAREVKRVDKLPTLKNNEMLRTVYL